MRGWARTASRGVLIWVSVLAGLAGGVGVFAVAGWSRTRGALPAFERFSPAADAAVADDNASAADPQVLEQIVKAAGANASLLIADVAVSLYRPDGTAVRLGSEEADVQTVGDLGGEALRDQPEYLGLAR